MPTRSLDSRKIIGISLFAGALVVAACGGAQQGSAGADLDRAKRVSPQGAAVYARECGGCHGKSGEGQGPTPSVMGDSALPREASDRGPIRTAQDLFDYVKGNMPLPKSKVGTLSDEDYWAVTTYMVVANGKMTPQEGLNASNASGVVINP